MSLLSFPGCLGSAKTIIQHETKTEANAYLQGFHCFWDCPHGLTLSLISQRQNETRDNTVSMLLS